VSSDTTSSHAALGTETQYCAPEIVPLRIERALSAGNGRRINLLVPAVSESRTYGGPATAVRLFHRLSDEFDSARLILTHESDAEFDRMKWEGWEPDRGQPAHRSIAFLPENPEPLRVSQSDFFLATFWSTAVYAKQLLARRAQWYPQALQRFAYLIQDYEPGFYPWSSQYVYARSSYLDTADVIGLFCSQQLCDYFHARQLHFGEEYTFSAIVNPRLLEFKAEIGLRPKERLIVVYGRPSHPRNAFDLIVTSLKLWASTFSSAGDWTVVSAGQPHADVPLSSTVKLSSLGKLTLREYADYLSRCWAGLSFVLSPHPGNPPIELARFGAWSITNCFECKDLSGYAPNLISVDTLTPEVVAEHLSRCCNQFRPGLTCVTPGINSTPDNYTDEFPFVRELMRSWTQTQPMQ
jgi:hypothetical protein